MEVVAPGEKKRYKCTVFFKIKQLLQNEKHYKQQLSISNCFLIGMLFSLNMVQLYRNKVTTCR